MEIKKVLIFSIVIIIAIAGFLGWQRFFSQKNEPAISELGWETFKDQISGAEFQYPKELSTKYISIVDWPPKVAVKSEAFSCVESGSEIMQGGKTEKRMVDNRTYCVTKITEGAAGSIYTTYTYAALKENKTVIFAFTLRAVQCANYDEPKKSECEQERETFDIDGVVDRIAKTLKFNK